MGKFSRLRPRRKPSLLTTLWVASSVFMLAALVFIGLAAWAAGQQQRASGLAAQVDRLQAELLQMELLQMELLRPAADAAVLAATLQRLDQAWEQLEASVLRGRRTGRRADPVWQGYRSAQAYWLQLRQLGGMDPLQAAPVPARSVLQRVDDLREAAGHEATRWNGRLRLFHGLLMLLAVGAAGTFMLLGYVLVLGPVARLQAALQAMRQGRLGTRLHVISRDEFGQLAAGFNRMARALQSSHDGLERKVREKTASIEEQNQRLAALYAVSALAADADDLDALAQGFMHQLRQVAGCDGAALCWSDEVDQRYQLLATDGLPESFVRHEQNLPTGLCECGESQHQDGVRVIALDAQRADAGALSYCARAGFRSVVGVPVRLQQRVLGEVTLFYREAVTLAPDRRELLLTMARHLASSVEGLRAAALERESAVAAERQLIARELHDSIAQSLAFLKIQMRLLRAAVAGGDTDARDRSLDELDVGVQESLADVRELLLHFRTRTREDDIESALRVTLSKFEHQTGIATELSLTGHGVPLAPDMQIQVLHIVQEALSNVRKHARARHVALRVQRYPQWRFEVRDDGCGFDASRMGRDPTHVGLEIMRERAQRIGARLRVQSATGSGTRVQLELPAMRIISGSTQGAVAEPA